MTVCAVVVTHDRRELLEQCLTALNAQTRPADALLVVDNASTDGSSAMVAERFPEVEVLRLETNGGGAGGFNEGMRVAYLRGFDWLWLMDDDTIPNPDALERLLAALERLDGLPHPALLASHVLWRDRDLHPKNWPVPRVDETRKTLVEAAGAGLLLIRLATFVSILVSRDAIARHGLPHKHYFIWGDDAEFTARLLRDEAGYVVPDSVVEHRTPSKDPVGAGASPQYYFEVRNKLLMLRGSSWRRIDKPKIAVDTVRGAVGYLRAARFRPKAGVVVARAVRDGLTQPVSDESSRVPPTGG